MYFISKISEPYIPINIWFNLEQQNKHRYPKNKHTQICQIKQLCSEDESPQPKSIPFLPQNVCGTLPLHSDAKLPTGIKLFISTPRIITTNGNNQILRCNNRICTTNYLNCKLAGKFLNLKLLKRASRFVFVQFKNRRNLNCTWKIWIWGNLFYSHGIKSEEQGFGLPREDENRYRDRFIPPGNGPDIIVRWIAISKQFQELQRRVRELFSRKTFLKHGHVFWNVGNHIKCSGF